MAKSSLLRSFDPFISAGILPAVTSDLEAVASQFSISITPAMLALIDPHDKKDPIAKQFMPSQDELSVHPQERADPIGDEAHSPIKGIVHRYPDRLLFKLLNVCPVYCRFCFRREQLGKPEGMLTSDELANALDYIRQHQEVWEVILSGGDPLMLSDRRLAEVILELNSIPHVKVLRIHTRLPVIDPSRISEELFVSLKGRIPVYILLHCNHARELTIEARAACGKLVDAGFPMLSQSVLLKDVNDTAESLENLMRAFVECRIKPHYLHHLDLARGTNHFRVSLKKGQGLLKTMRGKLSGLCQPTYILDLPDGHGKVPLGPTFAIDNGDGWLIEDFKGHIHAYHEPEAQQG